MHRMRQTKPLVMYASVSDHVLYRCSCLISAQTTITIMEAIQIGRNAKISLTTNVLMECVPRCYSLHAGMARTSIVPITSPIWRTQSARIILVSVPIATPSTFSRCSMSLLPLLATSLTMAPVHGLSPTAIRKVYDSTVRLIYT